MIARAAWEQAIPGKLMGFEGFHATFYVTRHPASESDDYFREIGEFLHRKHGGQLPPLPPLPPVKIPAPKSAPISNSSVGVGPGRRWQVSRSQRSFLS
jgi:hypothetical protein